MTTQRQITIEDIMNTEPCYSEEKVRGLFGDLPFVTVDQIAGCGIPDYDRVWALVYLLSERSHVVEFADGCAERAKECADTAYWANAAADAAERAGPVADYAIAAAADSDSDHTAAAAYYAERELQITHLKELHAREESSDL